MKKKLAYFVALLILLVCIELLIGWRVLLEPWTEAAPSAILLAAMLILVTYLIRAARMYRFFTECRDIRPCIRLFLLHNVFVNLLPMHSGEVSFPVLMKRYFGIPPTRSVAGLLWLRYLDFHTLVSVALLALWLAGPWDWLWAVLLAWSVVPVGSVCIWRACCYGRQVRRNRIRALIDETLGALPESNACLVESWGWTTLNWGVKLVVLAWILTIFSPLKFEVSLFGAAGGEVSSIVPIHAPAGLGTYEAGVVAAVAPFGAGFSEAMVGALNLHLFLIGMSLVGALVTVLFPAPPRRRASATVS